MRHRCDEDGELSDEVHELRERIDHLSEGLRDLAEIVAALLPPSTTGDAVALTITATPIPS